MEVLLIETRIAKEQMVCDALADRLSDLKPDSFLSRKVIAWWKSYKGISEGDHYVHYEFSDGKNFNARFDINRDNFRKKLYPLPMMEAINKYFKTHKLN